MTSVAKDPNLWKGDLNGNPAGQSLTKTNGGVDNHFGNKEVVSGGQAKMYGNEHRVVFELTGDGILTEDVAGVQTPLVEALNVHIPRQCEIYRIDEVVHQSFLGGVSVTLLASPTPGVAPVAPPVAIGAAALTGEGYFTGAGISEKTNEFGGELYIDFTPCLPNPGEKSGGKAEVIVHYRTI